MKFVLFIVGMLAIHSMGAVTDIVTTDTSCKTCATNAAKRVCISDPEKEGEVFQYADKCCDTADTTSTGCTSSALCVAGSTTDLKPLSLCKPDIDSTLPTNCGSTNLKFTTDENGEDGIKKIDAAMGNANFCGFHIYHEEDEEDLKKFKKDDGKRMLERGEDRSGAKKLEFHITFDTITTTEAQLYKVSKDVAVSESEKKEKDTSARRQLVTNSIV